MHGPMSLADVALLSVLAACFGTALTLLARDLAPLSWLMRKPLSCDLCMSSWCGLVGLLILKVTLELPWLILAYAPVAATVGIFLLKALLQLEIARDERIEKARPPTPPAGSPSV